MFAVRRWCFAMLYVFCQGNAYGSYVSRKGTLAGMTGIVVNPLNRISPALWATNIVRGKSSATSNLEDGEPGFDLSEEEIKKLKIWPGGVIPYYIDEFSFDKVFRDRIRTFLDVTNSISGLSFIELHTPPEEENTRWVFFVNRQGLLDCADHPFKNFTTEGVQKVVLGYDCLCTGGELAEVVLALVGVPPQHNAPNRLEFVQIMKNNIMPGKAYLFETIKDDEWLFHDIAYDFSSASHYSLHKYTKNGMATIKPKVPINLAIGEGKGFSHNDIWKIRMLYNYISKKRFKSIKLPECQKLFNVGSNFSRFDTDSEDDVQPRKKPNKYLGLAEEPEILNEKSQTYDITIDAITNSNEDINEEELADDKKPEKEENLNNKSDDTKEESDDENLDENSQENKALKKLNAKVDNAMLYLSDYQTGDEHQKVTYHKMRFTKPGGKKRKQARFTNKKLVFT